MYEIAIRLPFNGFHVNGTLSLPVQAKSLIIFSQGFGNSLLNPQMQKIAQQLQQEEFGTLHLDLPDYGSEPPKGYKNIKLLSHGLVTSTRWLQGHSEYRSMNLAYFGCGIGTAAALGAAGKLGSAIKTVVSLSGSPDLTRQQLSQVSCPVLLIAGELDFQTLTTSKKAIKHFPATTKLIEISEASHLFKDPGKAKEAAYAATRWFKKYLSHVKQTPLSH